MATQKEADFIATINALASQRQVDVETAFAAYGYDPTKLAQYNTDLVAADTNYMTGALVACTTAGISPTVLPPTGAPFAGNSMNIVT